MIGVNNETLIRAVDDNFEQWVNIGSVGNHIIDKGYTYTLKTNKSFQPQSASIIQYTHVEEVFDSYGNLIESHSLQPNAYSNSAMAPSFHYYENGLRAFKYNWNNDYTIYYANNASFLTEDHHLIHSLRDSMGIYQGKIRDHHLWFKNGKLNFHSSLVSIIEFDFDFPGAWFFEFVSGSLHAINNVTQEILRLDAVNMEWIVLDYPNISQSYIIENGGVLFARNDSFTFVLNHENDNFSLGDTIGLNEVLSHAMAWNADIIFNADNCGAFYVSTDQGSTFSPYHTNSFQGIISNVQIFQNSYYLDHYIANGNSSCELNSFCIEEAGFNPPNEIIFKSTLNNSYEHSNAILTHFDNVIYLSTDDGITFDSVATVFSSNEENRKIIFGLDSLVLVLGNDIYASTDLGQSWAIINMAFNDISIQDNKLLGVADDGLFWIKSDLNLELISTEGGKHLAGKDSTLLVIKGNGRSIKSNNLGLTWTAGLQIFKKNIRFLKTSQFILSYGYTDDYTTNAVISNNLGETWKILSNATPFGTDIGILWLNQIDLAASGAPINGWAVPGDGYLYAMGREKGLWKTNIDNLFRNNSDADIYASICDNEQYELDGNIYEAPGIYLINTMTGLGCDSSYLLNLNMDPTYFNQESISLEYGDTIFNHIITADTVLTFQYNSQLGCDSIHQYNISVLTSSGNTQFTEDEYLIIYPTPFEDFITIKSESTLKRVSVSDINGMPIYESILNGKKNIHQLNLETLSTGLYFLTIQQESGIIKTKKIIKSY